LVKPASIGTPLPDHARSYEGVKPQMPRPLYAPEEVARVVLAAAEKPTANAYVGGMGRAYSVAAGVAPRTLEWIEEKLLVPLQRASSRPADGDNLDHGRAEAKVHGPSGGRPSLYSAATRNPVATIAVAGGIAAAGAFMLRRRGDDGETQGQQPEARRRASGRSELMVVKEVAVIEEDAIPVEGN
jgi:hypothetical protein